MRQKTARIDAVKINEVDGFSVDSGLDISNSYTISASFTTVHEILTIPVSLQRDE